MVWGLELDMGHLEAGGGRRQQGAWEVHARVCPKPRPALLTLRITISLPPPAHRTSPVQKLRISALKLLLLVHCVMRSRAITREI